MHISSYLPSLKSGCLLTVHDVSQLLATRQQFNITAIVCACVTLTIAVHRVTASIELHALYLTAVSDIFKSAVYDLEIKLKVVVYTKR